MKARKILSMVGDISAMGLFLYLLIFPQYATTPTREALEFCYRSLIPALFIYMVLAKILISLPLTEKILSVLGLEAFALITGAMCGAPVGAKNALTLYESGRISKKHAEFLCSFTNIPSFSFVVGFVGSELLGDTKSGFKILFFQITASLVTATVMKFLLFGKEKIPKPSACSQQKVSLKDAVSDSAVTMLNLCASVVFFMVAGYALSNLLNLNPTEDAVLKSIFEFSSGCAQGARLGKNGFYIIVFAIGFTGLSVGLQVKSVISNKLSFRPYLLGKLISCSVMMALAVICG